LYQPDRSMLRVASVTRDALAVEYARVRLLKPWPDVRKEISWPVKDGGQIEMELDELDISNQILKLLLATCERKCKNKHLSPTDRRAAGAYVADRSRATRRWPGESPGPGTRR
jgi:hypothetical protein